MAKIDSLLDEHGGRGVSKESGAATYKELLEATRADLATLLGVLAALTAKLDADSGDTGGDADYAATLTDGVTLTLE